MLDEFNRGVNFQLTCEVKEWDTMTRLGKLIVKRWKPSTTNSSFYWHYNIVHAIPLMDRYGSLLKFANEGSECTNYFHALIQKLRGIDCKKYPRAFYVMMWQVCSPF
jgi:hypothetical protein